MVVAKSTLPARSEIPAEYTWNAPSVFADRDAWEAATEDISEMIPQVATYNGRLSEGPQVLADCMEINEKLMRLVMKTYFYAAMSSNVDATDKEANAMTDRIRGLFGQARAAAAFIDPELLAIGRETLDQWIESEPRLANIRMYVDNLFRRGEHVRSIEVEQVLGMVADPFGSVSNIFGMLTSADMQFKPVVGSDGEEYTVAQGTMPKLMSSADREVRRTAFQNYRDTYLSLKNTITSTYLTSVKQDVFNARVRGFNNSLEASLFQNNIPVAVFENLIETYKKNIPTWHKYWAVRRKALGVDELRSYDIWAPIAKESVEVSYEQAVEWIANGMQPLGDDYVAALRKGSLEDRWVDVYPNVGKRAGAFSFGTYDTYPFIMMSFDDGMGGMSTLAHELGHSLHSYHSRKYQSFWDSSYSLFVAEVASNFNQALTRAYLREAYADDDNFQIALIEEAMSNFHRYFFVMPTLARFELEVHQRAEKGKGMTADDLNSLMLDLLREGYGDELAVDEERDGITWATFQHLYSAYYVYQYATGISAAHALAEQVLTEGEPAAKRYVEFLSAGSSMYALDALKHAGVDMTEPDAVETTFGVLADMVDRLEQLTQ